uniref:Uncharacterized protein n=1 Tax=Aureoumbra lagunensis TaxID=44058 RepID=A0A7S3JWS7_9STRA|mmetsp:Transcript_12592/g.16945  ORF Transcript_12592/g.16945 Transcript_12592/m.16945 type:complete len:560 (-) Transcript_12592:120-1799(-)
MKKSERSRYIEERELDGYILAWSLHRILETIGGGNQTLGWGMAAQLGIVGMVFLSFLLKSAWIWACCILLYISFDIILMPFIWDSEYWCILTDLAMLLAILITSGDRTKLLPLARKIICIQMVIFYTAAAVWKLNKDFFDARASCAPIFVAQMIDLITMGTADKYIPISFIQIILQNSPFLVILLEGFIAIALSLPAGREFGVYAACILHILIAVCPPPNNVATFSLMCLSRLVIFVPNGLVTVLTTPPLKYMKIYWLIALPLSSFLAWHSEFYDLILPIFIAAVPLLWKAAKEDSIILRGLEDYEATKVNQLLSSKKSCIFKAARAMIVFISFFYSFGLLSLGLLDQGAPHMYANLRLHAGSNHFFLPTGLLQQYKYPSAFDGGIVRIERSTSSLLNRYYPSEYTNDLSQGTRDLLTIANHTGRMFNPMLSLVTASEAPWNPNTSFIKYTMPAHEFRRMLQFLHSQEKDSYLIEYIQLDDISGDEVWRATSNKGRLIRFEHSPKKNQTKCRVLRPRSSSCLSSDLVNLPPLPFWTKKLLLFEPYPILPNDHRLHCFGP